MTKFNVYFTTVASATITVEAEDGEAAIEAAFQQGLPYAPAFSGFDLGEWMPNSEFDPRSKPEDDYEEVS